MRNKFISLIASLLFAGEVYAQVTTAQLMGAGIPGEAAAIIAGIGTGGTVQSNNGWLKFRNAADSADLEWAKVDASDDLFINADSGDVIKLSVARTPFAVADTSGLTFQASGQNVVLAAYVPTMAATPVIGTNNILQGMNVIPTAAANAAAIIGASTPVPGQQFTIVNTGPNSVRLKSGGGATMNGATAGGYVVLATLQTAECIASSATNYNCHLAVNPTPAGP